MGTDVQGTGLPWVEAIAGSFTPYPFAAFHLDQLPQLVARHGSLIAEDLRGARPIAFRVEDGTTFTWVATDDGMQAITGGAGGADDTVVSTLVELSESTFSEFLHELLTASGAVRTGRARIVRGELVEWQRWEPAIRSVMTGREIYGPGVWSTLVGRRSE